MQEKLEIITCSYGPDRLRCERLCRSIDRFVPEEFRHTVIVPARDLRDFQRLANSRRTVLAAQDVVPGRFHQLPRAERLWMDRSGWPVRGWIMQQITKLSANHATDAELLLFADSDLVFVRDFDLRSVYRDGRLRLHRIPGAKSSGVHLQWHRRSATLLGEQPGYFGSDYVGQLITWRRTNLQRLQEHIQQTQGRPWYVPVARSLRFSEYVLYGSYVEHVLGSAANGHFFCAAEDLCHCCWFRDEAELLRDGKARLRPRAMALLIQSNLKLTTAEESKIFAGGLQQVSPTIQGA